MPNNSINRGTPFSVTATGTSSASASFPKTTNVVYVTDISGTSTTAGTWALLGGVTGTTTYWAGNGNVVQIFESPIEITSSGTVTFLMNGATFTAANISGYTI